MTFLNHRTIKTRETGPVGHCLAKFSNAVLECVYSTSGERVKHFVEGLQPEAEGFVYVCRPPNTTEAISLAASL